jgi:hypothetical protein
MKALLLSAALLTGCAQPIQPTPIVTPEEACITAMAHIMAFAQVGGPIIDKCLAGDRVSCDAFAMFVYQVRADLKFDEAQACLENGHLAGHPLLVMRSAEVMTPFAQKLKRYNRRKL